MAIVINHKGKSVTVNNGDNWQEVCDRMVAELGTWEPGVSSVTFNQPETVKAMSDFGHGNQIVDEEAKARIERQQRELQAQGIGVDAGKQRYATGTRMASVGYTNQSARAIEHSQKQTISDVCERLVSIIQAEQRESIELSAAELGSALDINGALTFRGLKLREQAIRGLLGRIESTALRHVLGLRDRIANKGESEEHKAQDREQLVEVLRRECKRFGNVALKIRARKGLGDIFAIMSPEYGEADAPEVLAQVRRELPTDSRGSYSYDPVSTMWELRANVWTPTPVNEQAVGEAFEGYASLRGVDNATGRLIFGGGVTFLACLNAGTYQAETREASRVHRSRVMVNLRAGMTAATSAINALCSAWGIARADVIERPANDSGQLIPLEVAIPGFYRHMLTSRKGELVGVLPGRTEKHVEALSMAYDSERRDSGRIVRADLANGFTRYIQKQPTPVRREAEAAIASWLVKSERVAYVAA